MDTDISQAKKLNSKPRARGRPRKKSADEPQEDVRSSIPRFPILDSNGEVEARESTESPEELSAQKAS